MDLVEVLFLLVAPRTFMVVPAVQHLHGPIEEQARLPSAYRPTFRASQSWLRRILARRRSQGPATVLTSAM